ncbi:MAG: CAP domain-containing protein [Pyrinomonadaceae bacterium]
MKSLRSAFASAVVCLSLLAVAVSAPAAASDDELRIFDLVNQERARRSLPPLEWDARLNEMARRYSRSMAEGGFFDHYDPSGGSVVDRARAGRVNGWRRIGENLFFCSASPRFTSLAVRGWLASPSHRENMLDRRWTATGIGVARSRSGAIYVTEVFIED